MTLRENVGEYAVAEKYEEESPYIHMYTYIRSNVIQRGEASTFLDIVPFSLMAVRDYSHRFSAVCCAVSFSFIQNAKSMDVIFGRLRTTDASYAGSFFVSNICISRSKPHGPFLRIVNRSKLFSRDVAPLKLLLSSVDETNLIFLRNFQPQKLTSPGNEFLTSAMTRKFNLILFYFLLALRQLGFIFWLANLAKIAYLFL